MAYCEPADHRWVRLVESAPDFPEDICVICHCQRGIRISDPDSESRGPSVRAL